MEREKIMVKNDKLMWENHKNLERGNPVRKYYGMKFEQC